MPAVTATGQAPGDTLHRRLGEQAGLITVSTWGLIADSPAVRSRLARLVWI